MKPYKCWHHFKLLTSRWINLYCGHSVTVLVLAVCLFFEGCHLLGDTVYWYQVMMLSRKGNLSLWHQQLTEIPCGYCELCSFLSLVFFICSCFFQSVVLKYVQISSRPCMSSSHVHSPSGKNCKTTLWHLKVWQFFLVLLEGSPGVGKTSLIEAIGKFSGHSVVRINLSDQVMINYFLFLIF